MEGLFPPMILSKRLFDLVIGIILSVLLCPLLVVIALLILVVDGKPVFYVSERMKTPTQGFDLIKFRTMKHAEDDSGVSGGDKVNRITRTGAFLRGSRLDELPQIWNILWGDISFVGPRPPLRQYVERFPDLYHEVLKSRPGVTGLASIYFHAHEEYLLAHCQTHEETDATYCRACIPRKARLDLIYQANRTACMDFALMVKTVVRRAR
jgi:lipopolysaccharide/colanic/teichoic acid biosynthesis glycosyltransferase